MKRERPDEVEPDPPHAGAFQLDALLSQPPLIFSDTRQVTEHCSVEYYVTRGNIATIRAFAINSPDDDGSALELSTVLTGPKPTPGKISVRLDWPHDMRWRLSRRGENSEKHSCFDKNGKPLTEILAFYAVITGKPIDRIRAIFSIPGIAAYFDSHNPAHVTPSAKLSASLDLIQQCASDSRAFNLWVSSLLVERVATPDGLKSLPAWQVAARRAADFQGPADERPGRSNKAHLSLVSALVTEAAKARGIPPKSKVRDAYNALHKGQGTFDKTLKSAGFKWLPTKAELQACEISSFCPS